MCQYNFKKWLNVLKCGKQRKIQNLRTGEVEATKDMAVETEESRDLVGGVVEVVAKEGETFSDTFCIGRIFDCVLVISIYPFVHCIAHCIPNHFTFCKYKI